MTAADADLRCLHCDALPTLKEMTDGWCDSCGKRLHDACLAEAKRQREAATATAPTAATTRSRPRLLWGAAAILLLAVAAVVAVAV